VAQRERKPKPDENPPERRIADVRRRLAALRERKRPEEDVEKIPWPEDLNAKRSEPGEWGADPVEGDRE
jgi:hypothetical protein